MLPCCTWQTSSASSFYVFVLAVTTLWGLMSVGALRRFVVSGTVAQVRVDCGLDGVAG